MDLSPKNYNKRPDRFPFILNVPSSIFHSTSSMPIHNNRYPCIVGEHFWKLASYIDSIPSRLEERVPHPTLKGQYKSPHIFISGPPGCGKSYLLAATSTLLTIVPSLTIRKSQNSFLNSDYKSVFIGDCSRWIESPNPLEYFRVEMLAAFQNTNKDFSEIQDHRNPSHLGCLLCVEPFNRLDQLKKFLERCCSWQEEYEPDTNLLFFFDQIESLTSQSTIQIAIIQILQDLRLPILIFSSGTSRTHLTKTLESQCSLSLEIPNSFNKEEFNKLLSFHSSTIRLPDAKTSGEHHLDTLLMAEAELAWKELRIWSGGNPLQIGTIFTIRSNSKKSLWEAISIYGERRMVKGVALSNPPSAIFPLIFCMITRLPISKSTIIMEVGENAIPKTLWNLLHPWDALVTFSDDSISSRPLVLDSIPSALNISYYLSIIDSILCVDFIPQFIIVINWILKGKHSFLCNQTIRRTLVFYRQFQLYLLYGKGGVLDVKFDLDIWNIKDTIYGVDFLRKGVDFMLIYHGGVCPCDSYFAESGSPSPFGPLKDGGRVFVPYSTICQMFDFVILQGDILIFYSSNPIIYESSIVLKYISNPSSYSAATTTTTTTTTKNSSSNIIMAMEAWRRGVARGGRRKRMNISIKLIIIENSISKYRSQDDFGNSNINCSNGINTGTVDEPPSSPPSSPSHPLPLFTKALIQQFLKRKK